MCVRRKSGNLTLVRSLLCPMDMTLTADSINAVAARMDVRRLPRRSQVGRTGAA